MTAKKTIEVSVIGSDKKGVIAAFTSVLFDCGVNIEDLEQTVREDFFLMKVVGNINGLNVSLSALEQLLATTAQQLGMEVRIDSRKSTGKKRLCLMVTRERRTPEAILQEIAAGRIDAEVTSIIGNREDLRDLAAEWNIPFFLFDSKIKAENEAAVVDLFREQPDLEPDLIVLARYMQILSPEFCFRYEKRIINIHPSLLPAYPGARAYRQAFENGAAIAGATAHFVTMDLDRGPIIYQESFSIDKSQDSLQDVLAKGQELEARILSRAVRMFCADELSMHWGKVYWRKSPYGDGMCPDIPAGRGNP